LERVALEVMTREVGGAAEETDNCFKSRAAGCVYTHTHTHTHIQTHTTKSAGRHKHFLNDI